MNFYFSREMYFESRYFIKECFFEVHLYLIFLDRKENNYIDTELPWPKYPFAIVCITM